MRLIDADALMEFCNNLVDKTVDANDIARYPTAVGWISVNDRLPEAKINKNTMDYEYVLCATKFGDVRAYKFGSPQNWPHYWHGPQIMDEYVTHWMPLPEPPDK